MRKSTLILCAALVAGASMLFAAPLPASIKIGAVETLTGDNAAYGISIRKGLELAVAEINASRFLGSSTINLVVMDDKADKQEGISVFSKLLGEEHVAAIIGPTLSSTAFAADPVAQKAGVPVLATSNTANGITAMGDFIFRDSLAQSAVLPGTLAAVAQKMKPQRAALLYESTNEYSKSEADVAKAALASLGIQLVATESYAHGDSDFRTQLAKLNARHPDVFVFCSLIGEAIPVLQQAREIGITQPIVGGNGFNSPSVIKSAQSAAEGLIVGAAWFIDSPARGSQSFVKAYRAKYGSDPDQFAAQAYAAVYIMATAIRKAGSIDGMAIRDALASVRNLDCSLGSFSFDANRDAVHPSVTLVVQDGHFVLFQ
ncbi:MAG TPA: ABC transporter substrate-binding protein [Rectinemataceae bacterium]|nr:ABC transporter substrate-binding protein [Rectinemataceae bacterium]